MWAVNGHSNWFFRNQGTAFLFPTSPFEFRNLILICLLSIKTYTCNSKFYLINLHYHHQSKLTILSSLIFSHYPSLSAITLGKSSRRYPASTQSRRLIFTSRTTLECVCVGVYRRTSLISSSLLSPAMSNSVFFGLFVRWKVSGRTVDSFRELFKIAHICLV